MIEMMKVIKKSWRDFLIISLISLASTALIWLPFFLRLPRFWNINLPTGGMATIMKNFDGLYYVVIAKSLYHPEIIKNLVPFDLPVIYYAAHFPLYPLLIRIGSLAINSLWSMLSISVLAGLLSALVFYLFLKEFKLSKEPLWLTIIYLLFPARWLIVRSVGSPESLFILFLLLSFYFFKKKNWWLAGGFGALAQLTKPPGILLFLAYGIYLLWQNWQSIKEDWQTKLSQLIKTYAPLFLIPLALLAVSLYYLYIYGDFFAYFHSGDNIHLFWPPLQIFNAAAAWVGTYWLEEAIYIYLIGILGVIYLFKQKRDDLAIFAAIFYFTTLFISHRDISRYSLPMLPFILIAFDKFLVRKEFKIALAIIILPIYLYAINFIAGNILGVADWSPFL